MSINIDHGLLFRVGSNLYEGFDGIKNKIKDISYKSINDAVTDIDLFMEKKAFEQIIEIDPSSSIISEENKELRANGDTVWLLDPLDGTSNFIQGVGSIAISIAKIKNNEVINSIIVNLSNGEIFTAIKGEGAKLNNMPIKKISSSINLIGISTGFINRGGQVPANFNSRILGSQALHLCHVATGSFLGCVNYESKAWDDAAGSLIIKECGGSYSHKYMNDSWVDLAKDNISLQSIASHKSENLKIFQKLLENI